VSVDQPGECPSCHRLMRVCAYRDGNECRCGLFIAWEALYIANQRQRALAVTDGELGAPWVERDPGLRVTDTFGDIADLSWERTAVRPDQAANREALSIACANALEGSGLRIVGSADPGCRTLVLVDERGVDAELTRQRVYAMTPLGEEAKAVREVFRFIRGKHGPGRLWFHTLRVIGADGKRDASPIGYHVGRDESEYRGHSIGGVMHVLMGAYYFHAPSEAA